MENQNLSQVMHRITTGNVFPRGSIEEELYFVSTCISTYKNSYSQALQDTWVLYESGNKRNGFFVDFGAADGLNSSNSYQLLKEYNWAGIRVEPNPDYQAPLEMNSSPLVRAVTGICVAGKSNEMVDFVIGDDPTLATTYKIVDENGNELPFQDHSGKVLRLPTISLLDLLRTSNSPKHIDYISVDTEGTELEILTAFDFDEYSVDMWTIEYNNDIDKMHDLSNLMFAHNYVLRFPSYSRMDLWFIKRELVENKNLAIQRPAHRKRTIKTRQIQEITIEEL